MKRIWTDKSGIEAFDIVDFGNHIEFVGSI